MKNKKRKPSQKWGRRRKCASALEPACLSQKWGDGTGPAILGAMGKDSPETETITVVRRQVIEETTTVTRTVGRRSRWRAVARWILKAIPVLGPLVSWFGDRLTKPGP